MKKRCHLHFFRIMQSITALGRRRARPLRVLFRQTGSAPSTSSDVDGPRRRASRRSGGTVEERFPRSSWEGVSRSNHLLLRGEVCHNGQPAKSAIRLSLTRDCISDSPSDFKSQRNRWVQNSTCRSTYKCGVVGVSKAAEISRTVKQ
jgi:hypothetical protein